MRRGICLTTARSFGHSVPRGGPAGRAPDKGNKSNVAFPALDTFVRRHIGPRDEELQVMLEACGFKDMDSLIRSVVPGSVSYEEPLSVAGLSSNGQGENETLQELKKIAKKNRYEIKSFLGQGFYGTLTPNVILRNILSNPGWYTAYTPYQAEISQGRMEMLLNYQTMICDLTGMEMSNSSLLDEGSAAAEALSMCHALHPKLIPAYFVDHDLHPTTIDVVLSRAAVLGITVHRGDAGTFDFEANPVCGALLQYPATGGVIRGDMRDRIARIKATEARVVVASDLLALTMLTSPGSMGADICVGNSQRFGVPMGNGGPHAAFLAVKDSKTARRMPGRIMGVSKDREHGLPAIRMALQTREQHIRRDKATSNICTAQALLANMAAAYAIYHGPKGLLDIATRVHTLTEGLRLGLSRLDELVVDHSLTFDSVSYTLKGNLAPAAHVKALEKAGFNVRVLTSNQVPFSGRKSIAIHLDETTSGEDIDRLIAAVRDHVAPKGRTTINWKKLLQSNPPRLLGEEGVALRRTDAYLRHPTFNSYHSETEMMRYLTLLQSKDLTLENAMIPLGSCTMKLNAVSEMLPITWPELSSLHPLAPRHQMTGTMQMVDELCTILASITGFDAVSLQPNSGAAGEYAGLRAIREYQKSKGEGHRDICLIPTSAHGTNPASAVMCGLKVVPVRCLPDGYVDAAHVKELATLHADKLSCIMITYPSTFGVFEENVREIIHAVKDMGGQVYMDGANMNAQVCITSPGYLGADVCHLNLHKTFCIPHGGGGPGVGPIGVRSHLAPFLPGHSVTLVAPATGAVGPMTSAPLGSAAILPIPWMYVKMMGSRGLRKATEVAILNANYMRARLSKEYRIEYSSRGTNLAAHEFIVDLQPFNEHGIHAEDVAKRLLDFGFHAPTLNWPVPESVMVEPTESESKQELDRFCDAMIQIRAEIEDVVQKRIAPKDSPLVRAPHTLRDITSGKWDRPYSIEQAVYPLPWVRSHKFWPSVNRLDHVWGDRNLFCSCEGFAQVASAAPAKKD